MNVLGKAGSEEGQPRGQRSERTQQQLRRLTSMLLPLYQRTFWMIGSSSSSSVIRNPFLLGASARTQVQVSGQSLLRGELPPDAPE